MLNEPNDDFKAYIAEAFLQKDIPVWFPNLAIELIVSKWAQLLERGIDKSTYGTVRILNNSSEAPLIYSRVVRLIVDRGAEDCVIPVESLSPELRDRYHKNGVNFYSERDLVSTNGDEIIACVQDAFKFIGLVPSLLDTVRSLVRSIHIIDTDLEDVDMSFSEPTVPFSIFVSVPRSKLGTNAVRVAEAIVHESMHLLLTLIEQSLPLVSSDQVRAYSPWKRQNRPTKGILHGAYVFRVLSDFFSIVLTGKDLPVNVLQHLEDRRTEIDEQIDEVRELVDSSELTDAGRRLADRLVKEVGNVALFREEIFNEVARH
jgi:hypothetical protein